MLLNEESDTNVFQHSVQDVFVSKCAVLNVGRDVPVCAVEGET